jgi:amino acid adenylation domain-containing protein
MGLIGGILQPIYHGIRMVVIPTETFLRRPLLWLKAISAFRACVSGGPNFAFDLCVQTISAAERNQLDLGCWDIAFNGSEPIRSDTIERFANAFALCGFRRQAFYPCYGLAEATLLVSSAYRDEGAVVRCFDKRMSQMGFAVETNAPGVDAQPLVSSGHISETLCVNIVDTRTQVRCPPGTVGEIWIAGDSVASGYWTHSRDSEAVFGAHIVGSCGTFLRTGDLGFMHKGHLFIGGRLNDIIRIRGRSYYPQDIEHSVESAHEAVRPTCVAAFQFDQDGKEQLAIVCEVRLQGAARPEEVISSIRQAVSEEHEISVSVIVLLRRGSIPKTTSGKIRRQACRDSFLARTLQILDSWSELPGTSKTVGQSSQLTHVNSDAPPTSLAVRALLSSALHIDAREIDATLPISRYGLDSLSAIRFQSMVESSYGITIPVSDMFSGLTVERVCQSIVSQVAMSYHPSSEVAQQPESSTMSHEQRALWFEQHFAPESNAYIIARAFLVHCPLDPSTIRRALRIMVQKHEALRVGFVSDGGQPRRRVFPHVAVDVSVYDMLPGSDDEIRRVLVGEAERPFKLERPPLFRIGIWMRPNAKTILLLSAHHLVADLHSLVVLVRDLLSMYRGLLTSSVSSASLAEFDNAKNAGVQTEPSPDELARLWNYWAVQLAAPLPVVELPYARPRPLRRSARGAKYTIRLNSEVSSGLARLAEVCGTTLFGIHLAAFFTLLYRVSGRADLIVGCPIACRPTPAASEVIGYFVNTLPLRLRIPHGCAFRLLVERVRDLIFGAIEHQRMPLSLLVERVQPVRDPTRSPLFDILVTWQQSPWSDRPAVAGFALEEPGSSAMLDGMALESLPLCRHSPAFDLELNGALVDGKLVTSIGYSCDLFDDCQIQRLGESFHNILLAAHSSPDASLSTLPILSPDERRKIVFEWNDTCADHPSHQCVHELIEAQAERTPASIAITYENCALTYRDLNARANGLARRLRFHGVGPEVRVGLFLDRSLDVTVAILGVLKAGGVCVPLDPTHPSERIRIIMQDAGVSVVLSQAHLAARLSSTAVPVISVDCLQMPTGTDARNIDNRATPESAAYLIYTSGSTGRPKGVLGTHRGLCNRLAWMQAKFRLQGDDRVLQKTPLGFDVSLWEHLWPLLTGARLVVARPGGHGDPGYLCDLIAREQITTLHFVPSVLQVFLEHADIAACNVLKRVICSGEELTYELQQQFYRCLSCDLYNLYGPTEASIDVSAWKCRPQDISQHVPIGRPITNTQLYVLDWAMQLVPVGCRGEIYIGGVGVARGYCGLPRLTSERFVPDPFGRQKGSRLYRTGDIGRFLEDGSIEFLGRMDSQVKLHGIRIELGEIESVLRQVRGVRDVAAEVCENSRGDRQLVAYVVPDQGGLTSRELRDFVAKRLPEQMTPHRFVFLDALPLTASGKLNRQALGPPSVEAFRECDEPRFDEVEELLAGVWRELLSVPVVRPDDNFFALGGHSLLAMQVTSRVKVIFGVGLSPRDLFDTSNLAALAKHIRSRRCSTPLTPTRIERVPRRDEFPLSFAQERLWILAQVVPNAPAYNVAHAIQFTGGLSLTALRGALEAIVHRHEVLRSTIRRGTSGPVQVISSEVRLPLSYVDLELTPASNRRAELRERAVDLVHKPFDLEAGPLLRGEILRLCETEHVLVIVLHHIVTDGWSAGVLLSELQSLYPKLAAGESPLLEDLPIQYGDYACWQRKWYEEAAETRRAQMWAARLHDLPVLDLPMDRPRPPIQTFKGARVTKVLPVHLLKAIEALGRRHGATLFMTLLAALKVLFSRYSSQEDIVVATALANRDHFQIEGLVGFFVNTLVLRTDLSGNPTFQEVMRRVRETVLAAYDYRDVPFEKLVELLNPDRDSSRAPLAQVMIVLQNAPLPEFGCPGLKIDELDFDDRNARYDLRFSLEPRGGTLRIACQYNVDLFYRDSIVRLLNHFGELLERVVAEPEERLSTVRLLTDKERERAFTEWNKATAAFPEHCLHEPFAQRAVEMPDTCAVISSGERLTYGDIDGKAEAVAETIRSIGLSQKSLVAVVMDPGCEQVWAVLGILRSGRAYLPLDPRLPRKRLLNLLDHGLIKLVLTQSWVDNRLEWPDGVRRIAVDNIPARCAPHESSAAPQASLDDLAYVIYTSGSTGVPKGVMISHRGAANTIWDINGRFCIDCRDRILAFSDLSFDLSVYDFFGALSSGAAVVIPSVQEKQDPDKWIELISRERITVWNSVPAALEMLVAVANERGAEALQSLRLVLLSGDWIDVGLPNRLWKLVPSAQIISLGGATEASIWSVMYRVTPRRSLGSSIPYGKPLANQRMYVLDSQLEPCPVGVSGDIFIGGVGLALGYWRDDARTQAQFIHHSQTGTRLYRTGDRGRYLRDGTIEFLGRLDHQVKVHGFRIELSEVEAALRSHDSVEHAAVAVSDGLSKDRYLVAYVSPRPSRVIDTHSLQAYLREILPPYMVPAKYLVLQTLPMNDNGKIDRAALPTSLVTAVPATTDAPRSQLERIITGVVCDILQVTTIDIRRNFFDLGLTSLSLIRAWQMLRDRLMLDITLVELFRYPSIELLAGHLGSKSSTQQREAQYGRRPTRRVAFRDLQRRRGTLR